MMREGRIRSASLIMRRSLISPVPSRLGWRHCMLTTSGSGIFNRRVGRAYHRVRTPKRGY